MLSSTSLVQFNFFLFIMSFRQRGCELYELYQQEFLRYDDLLEECKEIIGNCEEFLTCDWEEFKNEVEKLLSANIIWR